MGKLKAAFLDKASIYPEDLDLSALDEVADWHWFDNIAAADFDEIFDETDVEVIVSNKVVIDLPLMQRCNQLKLVCVAATGFNNVDIDCAREKDIVVCNVRSYATASVSQHVFSLLLALNRKLFSYRADVLQKRWSDSEFFCYYDAPLSELSGKTLGIIGHGELGRAVADIARAFGMQIMLAKRDAQDARADRVDIDTLLSESDVVSLHCPLTDNNLHMIAAEQLELMKSSALLINTARGGLIDELALLRALKNNQIAGAALDVLEQEPPSRGDALLACDADNLIITPHIAWASRESRQRLVDALTENILAYQAGKPINIVV